MSQAEIQRLVQEINGLERRLEAKVEKAREAAEYWSEGWTAVVYSISDLVERVQARPKGRRFATVLDLKNLLAQEAAREGRDERRLVEAPAEGYLDEIEDDETDDLQKWRAFLFAWGLGRRRCSDMREDLDRLLRRRDERRMPDDVKGGPDGD